MADPIVNNQSNDVKKTAPAGVFGWGEDIFDNEELFQPVDGQVKKKENQEEDLDRWVDDSPIISDNEDVKEDTFDPIFSDEDEDKKEVLEGENILEETKVEEIIDTKSDKIPVEDFDTGMTSKDAIVNDGWEKKEDKEEEILVVEPEAVIIPDIEKEPEEEKSDLMKKFEELVKKTKELYDIAKMEDSQYVELVGWDTGKSNVMYNLWLVKEGEESDAILISKIETDNESKDQQQNNLEFKNENWSLEIFLDEQMLYDELEDLKEDQNKKMQVIDKLNKFIFLVSEELKVYERDKKEKERMEQERRKLRDIFRNF